MITHNFNTLGLTHQSCLDRFALEEQLIYANSAARLFDARPHV